MRVNRYKQWARYHFKGTTWKYKDYVRTWQEYMGPNNKPPINSTVGYIDPTFKWHRECEICGQCIEHGEDEYGYGRRITIKFYKQK